jgi:hypothetical protein
MWSKDNLSCARIARRYFSKHLLKDVVVQSGQSGDCPVDCMGYLYY